MSVDQEPFSEWAVMELMGHRKLAGLVGDVELAGVRVFRIDVFVGEAPEPAATQFYSPAALYCLTPTTEAVARAYAARNTFGGPVARYELATPAEVRSQAGYDFVDGEPVDPPELPPDDDLLDDPLDDLDEPDHVPYVPPRDDSADKCERCGHERHYHFEHVEGVRRSTECTHEGCEMPPPGGGPCPAFEEDIPF